jgi:Alkaline phosphatase
MKRTQRLAALLIALLLSVSLFANGELEKNSVSAEENLKYVFMFIGDGMSTPQINAAQIYNGRNDSPVVELDSLLFPSFPVVGIQYTQDATSFCPDSASTATSLSSGYKTHSGVIGFGIDKKEKGETIAEKVKAQKDWKVGIISTVTINHATPAAYYAHVVSRNNYYDIGLQMADSGFDYFGGGCVNKAESGGESIYSILAKKGYKVTSDKNEILSLNSSSGKVYAYTSSPQDSGAMKYDIDNTADDLRLADYVRKGIDVLDNENGFFMMVEGGKIDWAGHANDAVANISDVVALDDAIRVAFDFALAHKGETLIIVTGDHETGGMSLGYAGTGYNTAYDILKNQKMSYVAFDGIVNAEKKNGTFTYEKALSLIKENFGLYVPASSDDSSPLALNSYDAARLEKAYNDTMNGAGSSYEASLLYGGYNPLSITLTHIINNKAGIGWSSYAHTALPVPVYAYGAGAEAFDGSYDNTEVAKKLFALCDVK